MRIVIAGAGRFGRELACWMDKIEDTVVVFADDTGAEPRKEKSWIYPELVGTIDGFQIEEGDRAVIAVIDPRGRMEIASRLRKRGIALGDFVHQSAVISPTAKLSTGLIACPGSLISADAIVEELVSLNCYATVGHDVHLGVGCTLSSHVDICGNVRVGRGVFFGSGARVLPRLEIGEFAVIGAGAVVMRNVPAGATVVGNPAKLIAQKPYGDDYLPEYSGMGG